MHQNEARALARFERQAIYAWTCEVHGPADHSVKHGKCLLCFNRDGYRRSQLAAGGNSARIEARRAGAASYPGECVLHGEVRRSTIHGTCLECYSTAGRPRSASVNTLGVYIDKKGDVQIAPGA